MEAMQSNSKNSQTQISNASWMSKKSDAYNWPPLWALYNGPVELLEGRADNDAMQLRLSLFDHCNRLKVCIQSCSRGTTKPLYRLHIARLKNSKAFIAFMMLVVLLDFAYPSLLPQQTQLYTPIEYLFLLLYVTEMVIKMLADGILCGKQTYFRSGWNKFDFTLIVVMASSVTIGVYVRNAGGPSFNPNLIVVQRALRSVDAFRILRCLRVLYLFRGLRSLLDSMIRSVTVLSQVFLLSVLWIVIIALIGVQLFSGKFKHRCVKNLPFDIGNSTVEWWQQSDFSNISQVNRYKSWTYKQENWEPVYGWDGMHSMCGNGSGARSCGAGYTCLELPDVPNPFGDMQSFDTFSDAALLAFQLTILDEWTVVYVKIVESVGPAASLYFILTVFLGGFQLLNTVLALINIAYERELQNEVNKRGEETKSEPSELSFALSAETFITPPTGTVARPSTAISTKGIRRDSTISRKYPAAPPPTRVPSLYTLSEPISDFRMNLIDQFWELELIKQINVKFNEWVPPAWLAAVQDIRSDVAEASQHPLFAAAMGVIIFINLIMMALDSENTSVEQRTLLRKANAAFTVMFLVESTIKLLSQGRTFFKSKWNIFDLLVVVSSLADTYTKSTSINGITALRAFRMFRIVKIAKFWPTMRSLMKAVGNSLPIIGNMSIITVLVVIVFSLVGMRGLSMLYTNRDHLPRWRFDDFHHSVSLTYIIFCGEYIEPLFECLAGVQEGDKVNKGLCIGFISLIYVIGNLMILNLYVSIVLSNFGTEIFEKSTGAIFSRNMKIKFALWLSKAKTSLCQKQDDVDSRSTRSSMVPDLASVFDASLADAHTKSSITNLKGPLAILLSSQRSEKKSKPAPSKSGKSPKSSKSPASDMGLSRLMLPRTFHSSLVNTRSHGGPAIPENLNQSAADDDTNKSPREKVISAFRTKTTDLHKIDMTDWNTSDRLLKIFLPKNRRDSVSTCEESEEDEITESYDNDNETVVCERDILDGEVIRFAKCFLRKKAPAQITLELPADIVEPPKGQRSDRFFKEASGAKAIPSLEYLETERRRNLKFNLIQATKLAGVLKSKSSGKPVKAVSMAGQPPIIVMDEDGPNCAGMRKCWAATRRRAAQIVDTPHFEAVVLIFILLGTITQAMHDVYMEVDPELAAVVFKLDITVVIMILIESFFRVTAMGFTMYFTTFWCVMDCLIIIMSFSDLCVNQDSQDTKPYQTVSQAIRAAKALRPLRVIPRLDGLRVVVNALLYSLPSVINVGILFGVTVFLFSILSMGMFGGKMNFCHEVLKPDAIFDPAIISNKSQCLAQNMTWSQPFWNFDNVGMSYVYLFGVATFDNWIEAMIGAADGWKVDEQPREEMSYTFSILFFTVFSLIGSHFIMNLFIGVMIESFNVMKKQLEGGHAVNAMMTETQTQFYRMLQKLADARTEVDLQEPRDCVRRVLTRVVDHPWFDLAVSFSILVNIISMGFERYGMSDEENHTMEMIDSVFIFIFSIECILKIIAHSYKYFACPWNVFDFVIVIVSITGTALKRLLSSELITLSMGALRSVRIVRTLRSLQLVRGFTGARRLLVAMLVSMPALLNIAALLLLVMIIYSVVGMELFMHVKPVYRLNEVFNFRTIGGSMMVMFRMLTGVGWTFVLESLSVSPPYCNNTHASYPNRTRFLNENGDCGSRVVATIFCFTYIIICFQVIVNCYIALILENFEEHTNRPTLINTEYIESYYAAWSKLDPGNSQFIHYNQLSDLLNSLSPPLRIAKPNSIAVSILNINISSGMRVHCLDVLQSLLRYLLSGNEYLEITMLPDDLIASVSRQYKVHYPEYLKVEVLTTSRELALIDLSVRKIQIWWKRKLRTRKQGTCFIGAPCKTLVL